MAITAGEIIQASRINEELQAVADTAQSNLTTEVGKINTALNGKAPSSHTHKKADITDFSHTHDDRYYTESEIDTKVSNLDTAINGKAPSSHTHDDRYYTESEIDTKITSLNNKIITLTNRSRRDITSDLANLPTAIAQQNLEKYGYKIGDYFIGPSGYQYTLADMDSYYGGYDNGFAVVDTHHCAIVVDTKSTCQWLTSSTTATSYSKSNLHAVLKGTALNNIKSDMIALFGGTTGLEHLLSHSELDNGPDDMGSAWYGLDNTYICALSESQIYGNVWSVNGYQTGTANKKLELFSKYRFNEIFGNTEILLRSLRSAAQPCSADNYGGANYWVLSGFGRVCGFILLY